MLYVQFEYTEKKVICVYLNRLDYRILKKKKTIPELLLFLAFQATDVVSRVCQKTVSYKKIKCI